MAGEKRSSKGITKTDFMHGYQCDRMLWLDKHHPEYKVIPYETRQRLNRGNDFGDAMMGILGPFTEVREYTAAGFPNKPRMAEKTKELLALHTRVICEAAFIDEDGNYCAADILLFHEDDNTYEIFEVKNSKEVSSQHILDTAYQVRLIRSCGLKIQKASIVYHGKEPYVIQDITSEMEEAVSTIDSNIGRLIGIKQTKDEVLHPIGDQCCEPYECWYRSYCRLTQAESFTLPRCSWCNAADPFYKEYHDNEWGVRCRDDQKLFEILTLEMFQSGLTPETVLLRREGFRRAFSDFDPVQVSQYSTEQIDSLMQDSCVIKCRPKIEAAVSNSRAFLKIQQEFGSFDHYLETFCGETVIHAKDPSLERSALSNRIAADLRKRGMDWCGSNVVYSFLKAAGFINAHEPGCHLYRNPSNI